MIVGWMKLPEIIDANISSLQKRKKQSRRNSQIGKQILSRLLLEYYGVDLNGEENPIGKMEKGKPYLVNHPEIHFNISHSEDLVVCVVGETPVGIDVQYQKDVNIQLIAKKVLSKDEWQTFEKSGFQDEVFFQYWTKKESYLKYTGEGIRNDLRKMTYEDAKFQMWEPYLGYVGMICMSKACMGEVTMKDMTTICQEV